MEPTQTNCMKCTEPITAASFLRCRGFCGASFHLKCTSSTQQTLRIVQEDVNMFWYCDSCVKIMGTPQFRTAFMALSDAFRSLSDAHKAVIDDVKAELAVNNKKFDDLVAKLPADPPPAPLWSQDSSKKRLRSLDTPTKPAVPTPRMGINKVTSVVPIINKTVEPDNMWWLWLSSFPPSVTEDDIRSMVKEYLSCDANEGIEVKMLVKKDVDITKLSAVTFKVGFNVKYREVSMDGNTWPAGVAFREFIPIDRKPTFDDSASGFPKNRRVD